MSTEKVKQTGKYGVRSGVGIRKKYLLATKTDVKEYVCPSCGFKGKIKKNSTGIYKCRKCNSKISGGAYKLNARK